MTCSKKWESKKCLSPPDKNTVVDSYDSIKEMKNKDIIEPSPDMYVQCCHENESRGL
jgi:hypothetical protein